MEIHSIAFPKQKWSRNNARTWLLKNKFKTPSAEVTPGFYRYRQRVPKRNVSFATKIIHSSENKPIQLIFMSSMRAPK